MWHVGCLRTSQGLPGRRLERLGRLGFAFVCSVVLCCVCDECLWPLMRHQTNPFSEAESAACSRLLTTLFCLRPLQLLCACRWHTNVCMFVFAHWRQHRAPSFDSTGRVPCCFCPRCCCVCAAGPRRHQVCWSCWWRNAGLRCVCAAQVIRVCHQGQQCACSLAPSPPTVPVAPVEPPSAPHPLNPD